MDPYRGPAPTRLAAAIEGLYHTFARYPRSNTEGCPCCVRPESQARLHALPLRELGEQALGQYSAKAMTTWGSVDDFRHFLPRIFELLANDELHRDPQIVIGRKLEYAKWREWRAREQEAIEAFVLAWCDDWRAREWLAVDALSTALLLGFEPAALLAAWSADERPTTGTAWLTLLEDVARDRTLDPWTSPETTDVISRWLWAPPQRARLMRIIETLPDELDRRIAHEHLDALGLRLR